MSDDDDRIPRLLIPDNTPLSLLSMLGKAALDWLFAIEAEVWVTDMVRIEALRDPDPGDDQRAQQRRALCEWFHENRHRIRVQSTPEGRDYEREMRNWSRGGSVPDDKPSWRNRGERSMAEILPAAAAVIGQGEAVVLLVDDRAARSMLIAAIQFEGLDADIMATETFLALLESDYGLIETSTAWQAIRSAADGEVPAPYDPDPVHVRSR